MNYMGTFTVSYQYIRSRIWATENVTYIHKILRLRSDIEKEN